MTDWFEQGDTQPPQPPEWMHRKPPPPAQTPVVAQTWECPRHGVYQETRIAREWHERERRFTCRQCLAEGQAQEAAYERAQAIRSAWLRSGVPHKFRNRRLSNYRITDAQSKQAVDAARALISADIQALALIGAVGRGKSHLSVAMVAEAVREGRSALWVYTPDLLRELRASYGRGAETSSDDILARLEKPDLLVLDEIGASSRSEWELNTLSVLIDDRYRNGGALVLTGNVASLADSIGVRGADRITEMGCTIVMLGQSYRSKAPDDAGLLVPDDFTEPERPHIVLSIRGVNEVVDMPI